MATAAPYRGGGCVRPVDGGLATVDAAWRGIAEERLSREGCLSAVSCVVVAVVAVVVTIESGVDLGQAQGPRGVRRPGSDKCGLSRVKIRIRDGGKMPGGDGETNGRGRIESWVQKAALSNSSKQQAGGCWPTVQTGSSACQ